eukprot:6775047-Prymnesium_polylepis.1
MSWGRRGPLDQRQPLSPSTSRTALRGAAACQECSTHAAALRISCNSKALSAGRPPGAVHRHAAPPRAAEHPMGRPWARWTPCSPPPTLV